MLNKTKVKKYLILLIICSITFIIVFKLSIDYIFESKIPIKDETGEYNIEKISTKENITTSIIIPVDPEIMYVAEEYKGYPVIAQIRIPKISVDTPVLAKYSEKALEVCVTKFYGGNPNEIGNFCISGHNRSVDNMFRDVKYLNIGDKITLIDNKHGEVEYEIYDIYKVKPTDTSCLTQETNGNMDITLITCTNDSKMRIIVKAKVY